MGAKSRDQSPAYVQRETTPVRVRGPIEPIVIASGAPEAPAAPEPAPVVVDRALADEPPSLPDRLAALADDLGVSIAYDGTTITVTSPAGAFTHPDAGAYRTPVAFIAGLRHRIRKLLSPRKPL